MAPVKAQTFSTEVADISETFWKLRQQLEFGHKTELIHFATKQPDIGDILGSTGVDDIVCNDHIVKYDLYFGDI